MTPELTPQEIEQINREAEVSLPVLKWEGSVPPGTDINEFPRHVYTTLLTRERLKQKAKEAEIQAYREGLNKIIDLYPNTESKAIIALNDMRQSAFDTLNQFKQ